MKQQQKQAQQLIFRRKAISLAVASVLPAFLLGGNAFADCAGSVASPNSAAITVLCNNSGVSTNGNLTNTSSTAYVNSGTTTTAGNNTLLQFDGQGRTLNNSGNIINNLVITGTAGARGRTAVLMGNATLNAGAGTVFTTNLPIAGVTTVTLNAAPTTAYVGQTIVFGRYDGDDFSLGEKRVITAVDVANKTVTFSTPLSADFAGAGTDPAGYKVVSNYGAGSKVGGEFYNNVIINSGTISSQILASEVTGNASGATSVSNTAAVKAITMSVEGDYLVNNSATGIISVTHGGLGNALAIEEGGTVEGLTINNAGLISAERTPHLTLVSVTATGNPTATSTDLPGLSAAAIGSVNAINTQEEAEEIEINNSKTGVIRSKGDYSGTIYMRAEEKTIVNEGLIEHLSTDGNHDKGFAIAAVSNPGEVRTLDLENKASGVIKGDILVVNGNALRWYLLSTAGVLDNRLNINSQYGQSDSAITNAGLIEGNFYYSNGTHELINGDSGTITGNIDVDQRNTFDVGGNGTLLGTKSFTFENAGAYSGNITVRTATGSEINLIATINGSGAGSTLTAPSSAVAGFGGTLKIYDGGSTSTANLATVIPVAATTVHAGEYFKLADTLFGSVLPTVQSDSALVSWVISKNAANNLVVGVDSVANAGSLGLTGANAAVIDGVLNSNAAIGGAVQGLATAADVQKAAEQLRPEINGASMNATLRTTSQVEGVVDTRISETHLAQADGLRGMAAGDGSVDSGVWLQGFGFTGQQDRTNNVDGYNANGGGIAAGADTLLSDALRVGAAFSYANTTLDAQGSNLGNNNHINSYQGMLYASWLADGWYLTGIAGIGQHQFDSRRLVNVGGVIDNPKANYDAWQYFGKVELGLPIAVNSQFSVVPVASLALSYLDQDAYTETSTGGAALSVQSNDSTSFRSGLGAKAFYNFTAGDIKTVLEGRALWLHEFGDTNQDTTASFASGGSTFIAQGVDLNRESFNLGGSLKFVNEDATQSLSLSYDAEIRDEYVGHTGKVQARFDF